MQHHYLIEIKSEEKVGSIYRAIVIMGKTEQINAEIRTELHKN